MVGAPGSPTIRWLLVPFWGALLIGACSMDLDPATQSTDDAALETVWTASGKCARRGKQMRCGGPATIVLASYPTVQTVDAARQQVWSRLAEQFSQGRFEIEQRDAKQTELVVKYTGGARPFIECAGTKTIAGKVQMGSADTSPGKLETKLRIRLEDAGNNKTTIHVTARHVLKHKDEAIKDLIEIQDRSVVPLGDGRVCWSTGTLERSAVAPDDKDAPQPQAPPVSQEPKPACHWNSQYYRYDCW